MELDGRRTQVWRSPECDALYHQLLPSFSELPHGFRRSANYHLGLHAAHPPVALLQQLRQAAHAHSGAPGTGLQVLDACCWARRCAWSMPICLRLHLCVRYTATAVLAPCFAQPSTHSPPAGLLSAETYTACDAPLVPSKKRELKALLAALDVFSPNEVEAASILGTTEALREGERCECAVRACCNQASSACASIKVLCNGEAPNAPCPLPEPAASAQGRERHEAAAADMAARLIALGAALVLLRRGPEGVLVAHGASGEAYVVGGEAWQPPDGGP